MIVNETNNMKDNELLTLENAFLGLSVLYIIAVPIVIFGILANIVNIFIYLALRLSDSLTISFFFLSVSDLAFSVTSLITVSCTLVVMSSWRSQVPVVWLISVGSLRDFVYWYNQLFYDTSMLVTTFIAVVRCCCVALPFHFKNMFTKGRTVVSVLILFLMALATRMPTLTGQSLTIVQDPTTNTTTLVRQVSSQWYRFHKANYLLNRNILPFACFIVTLICLVILTVSLWSASRFRHSTTADDHEKSTVTNSGQSETALKGRDLQVVKSVALVSAMFVILAVPSVIYSLARLALKLQTAGNYSLWVFLNFGLVCGYMNGSFNILIYYHCNSGYRKTFRRIIFKSEDII